MSDWTDQLQPASWRGVPFGVLTESGGFGRKVAVHEYPFRDKPWVEDLGRASRKISLSGFLVTDSLAYGGGEAIAQRNAMIAAAEAQGSGALVHPTLGKLTVSLAAPLVITGRWDAGRYFELEFSFIESGDATFPSNATATQPAVAAAADNADAGATEDFSTACVPLLPAGGFTIADLTASVSGWCGQIRGLATDATSLVNLASQLVGNYGRYFNGANAGAFGGASATLLPSTTTVADLASDAAAARGGIVAAAAAETGHASNFGLTGSQPTDLAAAAQATTAALLAACANPADAVRLLSGLATYADDGMSAVSSALDDLHRRAAVVALARAAMAYQPTSYDDANAVRVTVCAALDAEIEIAGNSGEDATFDGLRALRVAVVQDLTARGASLAPIATFDPGAALPALVLANRYYGDATRADSLVVQVDPIHPLFMPPSYRALAA